ncbi:MAG TPA: ArsR family transcriptional regulator [Anaerolineae bacterium]|nr:winged helix-turn-helix transcriptional regulator [Caldilineae bacterium]HID34768.1 ArsR family transcriptional regulator [Anaerolineae bacterium]HIQ12280.1 ArsR family transcriptional regulator [Caldilineales bacterium]
MCADEHDPAAVARAAADLLLDHATASRVADLFKALSDPTRVRIIGLLAHAELCVGDLARVLEMTQPAVSHQLRVLRHLRIVRARKQGRHAYYTLMDDHIHDLFDQGLAHVRFG